MLKLLAVVAVVLAACGDNIGGISLDLYAASTSDAVCNHAVACGQVADVESCKATSLGQPVRITASVRAAFVAGTIKFDGGAAQTCLAALSARSCDVTSQASRVLPDACFAIFLGTQGDGATCASNTECVSQVCDVPVCDDACCTGACVGAEAPARAQVGESCETARCVEVAFCDEGGVCLARRGAGNACLVADNCQFGLDCDPDGECATLPGPGEPCDGACRDEGTTCSQTTRTCVAVATEGEACAMSSDCSVFYVCDGSKHCSAGIALGAACAVGQRCADPGAFCDAPPGESFGVCGPRHQVNERCTGPTSCESNTCDSTTELCVDEPLCIGG